jgi:hypothetical protein
MITTILAIGLLDFVSAHIWFSGIMVFITLATIAGIIQTLSGKPAPKAPWSKDE